jgi:hypothetical protein
MHDQIHLTAVLHRQWSAWFDGLDVSGDEQGQTTIAGPDVDQAACTACWQGSRPRSGAVGGGLHRAVLTPT